MYYFSWTLGFGHNSFHPPHVIKSYQNMQYFMEFDWKQLKAYQRCIALMYIHVEHLQRTKYFGKKMRIKNHKNNHNPIFK